MLDTTLTRPRQAGTPRGPGADGADSGRGHGDDGGGRGNGDDATTRRPRPLWPRRRILRRLPALTERRLGYLIVGLSVAAFIVLPMVSPHDPAALVDLPGLPPSAEHPFGTDQIGRDMFVRVFMAGRLDLAVTVIAVGLCMFGGMTLGIAIASLGARARNVALRVIDAFMAIPGLVLLLALAPTLGSLRIIPGAPPGVAGIIFALTISGWAGYTRVTVSRALSLRERESVVAARLLGYGRARVLFRHVLPEVFSTNFALGVMGAVGTMGAVAGLAFLGVGIPEPTPDLGQMMLQGVPLLPTSWWIPVIPGLTIMVVGIGFGFIGDSLNERV
jgi:peptide/nickel transport system permease protein